MGWNLSRHIKPIVSLHFKSNLLWKHAHHFKNLWHTRRWRPSISKLIPLVELLYESEARSTRRHSTIIKTLTRRHHHVNHPIEELLAGMSTLHYEVTQNNIVSHSSTSAVRTPHGMPFSLKSFFPRGTELSSHVVISLSPFLLPGSSLLMYHFCCLMKTPGSSR